LQHACNQVPDVLVIVDNEHGVAAWPLFGGACIAVEISQ
jgi:hypothetical protein